MKCLLTPLHLGSAPLLRLSCNFDLSPTLETAASFYKRQSQIREDALLECCCVPCTVRDRAGVKYKTKTRQKTKPNQNPKPYQSGSELRKAWARSELPPRNDCRISRPQWSVAQWMHMPSCFCFRSAG